MPYQMSYSHQYRLKLLIRSKDQVFLKDNGRKTIKSLKNVGKTFIKSFFLIQGIIKLSKHIQLGRDVWL